MCEFNLIYDHMAHLIATLYKNTKMTINAKA